MKQDGFERRNNEALALQIEAYWRRIGFDVVVEVVNEVTDGEGSVWGLRSNTLDGLPRHRLGLGL